MKLGFEQRLSDLKASCTLEMSSARVLDALSEIHLIVMSQHSLVAMDEYGAVIGRMRQ